MLTRVVAVGFGALAAYYINKIRNKKMYDCHSDIEDYHNDYVTLSQGERAMMRKRRDANRSRIKKNLNDNDPKPIGHQTQGSYAMLTMVLDQNNDYDIDDGIYFWADDLKGAQGADLTPRKVKQIICDAAQDKSFSKEPEVRTNCVRVYYNDGSHVDIPVYRKVVTEDAWGNEEIIYEIAGAGWKQSDPKSVTEWFKSENISQSPDDSNGRQLRRITRLIKKFARSRESWKERITSGFIITKLVTECYAAYDRHDDKALYYTLKNIYDRLELDLEVDHPVLDEKLTKTSDDAPVRFFRDKLEDAIDALDILFEDDCDHPAALEAWGKFFRSTFFNDRANEKREEIKAALATSISSMKASEREEHTQKAAARLEIKAVGYQPWTVTD